MRKFLLIGLVVVLGMLVAADFAVKAAVENQLENRLSRGVPSATSESISISSFPFLPRLLISGKIATLRATITDIKAGSLTLSRVDVDLDNVRIDRSKLFRERHVVLVSVGSGTATAVITQAELDRAIGVPLELGDGKISIKVGPVTASADASIENNELHIKAGPVSIPALTIPKVALLPCATNAKVETGRIVVSCHVDQVPPELLEAVKSTIKQNSTQSG